MKNKQGFSAVALVIILAVLAVGGYAVWKKQTVTPPSTLPKVEGTPTSPLGGGSEGVENWKTYRNNEYNIEFKYPNGWEPIETSKGFVNLVANKNVQSIDKGIREIHISIGSTPKTKGFAIPEGKAITFMGKEAVLSKDWINAKAQIFKSIVIPGNLDEKRIDIDFVVASKSEVLIADQILSTFRFVK